MVVTIVSTSDETFMVEDSAELHGTERWIFDSEKFYGKSIHIIVERQVSIDVIVCKSVEEFHNVFRLLYICVKIQWLNFKPSEFKNY